MTKVNIKSMVLCGMFSAIISVVCPWSITIFTIPVTLSSFIISLAGYCLKNYWCVAATCVYIVLGAIGLPVFSNFNAGAGVLAGPTGGFLLAYPILAFVCSLAAKIKSKNKILAMLISFFGVFVLYVIGIAQFVFVTDVYLTKTFFAGMAPLILKDIISVICAYFLSARIQKVMLKI